MSLNLSNRNLEILSSDALKVGLELLICSNNQLKVLPDLPNSLQELECNNNQLTLLPALPPGLTLLNCNNNQLTLLPDLPPNLTELNCSNNRLALLPDLPSGLEYLDCGNNQLTRLPPLPGSLIEFNCLGNNIIQIDGLNQLQNFDKIIFIEINPNNLNLESLEKYKYYLRMFMDYNDNIEMRLDRNRTVKILKIRNDIDARIKYLTSDAQKNYLNLRLVTGNNKVPEIPMKGEYEGKVIPQLAIEKIQSYMTDYKNYKKGGRSGRSRKQMRKRSRKHMRKRSRKIMRKRSRK